MKKWIKWLPVYLAVIVAHAWLVTSCSKNAPSPTIKHTVEAVEIAAMLESLGVTTPNSFFADDVYALPSEHWLANEYSESLYRFLTSFKSATYVATENDCDNFSTLAFAFAQILHHNTPQKNKKTALAVGEIWYASLARGGVHAINVAMVWDDQTGYKIIFYEPQTQQIVQLTQAEIAGVKYYRF
jgi:hypothetical protein